MSGAFKKKSEDYELDAMRTLAVRKEDVIVARVRLYNTKLDTGEAVCAYMTRLQDQESVCRYT